MKTQSVRAVRGFTLVELLVVIVIIVILAGAGFSAGNSAIQKAKKTTCLAAATAIESAVNNYYTEYGSMPSNESTDTQPSAPLKTNDNNTGINLTGVGLLRVLLGIEPSTASPMYNPRKLKFLSAKDGKFNKNGLIYNSSSADITSTDIIGMFDPWGGPFNIMMDLDYDEKLVGVLPKGIGNLPVNLNGRRVAVWSDGADGVSAIGKAADDVKTWGQ
jgi:prepilin-type N-terminal cleavage/methylation domain-containing protein